jgi:hypothetical protein
MENILDVIDIEEYVKEGKKVPSRKKYKIRIDKERYKVDKQFITCREILTLAEKNPPEGYRLDMKFPGGQTEKIELDQTVDLANRGVERFVTLPLDATEG